jgi:iron complex transport system ATP-binding protein
MRGQKIALDDFSLRIRADEHVAILGPNGCGKSTLIKTIMREYYRWRSPNRRCRSSARTRGMCSPALASRHRLE